MLVTGGISAQMEQCLVQDKYYGIHEDSATIMSRRSRCKLGLLSLDHTILSDIEVSILLLPQCISYFINSLSFNGLGCLSSCMT